MPEEQVLKHMTVADLKKLVANPDVKDEMVLTFEFSAVAQPTGEDESVNNTSRAVELPIKIAIPFCGKKIVFA